MMPSKRFIALVPTVRVTFEVVPKVALQFLPFALQWLVYRGRFLPGGSSGHFNATSARLRSPRLESAIREREMR